MTTSQWTTFFTCRSREIRLITSLLRRDISGKLVSGIVNTAEAQQSLRLHPRPVVTSLLGVRTENTPKVKFSATVGEEPEVEVALA